MEINRQKCDLIRFASSGFLQSNSKGDSYMELLGNLKDKVSKAKTKEEAKEINFGWINEKA